MITIEIKKLIEENPLAFATVNKEGKWYQYVKNIPENKGEPCKGAILITIKNIKKLA